jgi:hypothetical protein
MSSCPATGKRRNFQRTENFKKTICSSPEGYLFIDDVEVPHTNIGSTMEGGGWVYTAGTTYIADNLNPGAHVFKICYNTKKGLKVRLNSFQINAIEFKR